MIKSFDFPVGLTRFKGLTYFSRFTANHTFGFLTRWEGKYGCEIFLRKLAGFQFRLTVVQSTTTGTVFRILVLLYFYSGMTPREGDT